MKIQNVRRISQIFFLLLFLWFSVVATLGEKWWQLRGWPVGWFLQLDPLVALGTVLTTRSLYAGLAWALLTIVLTIILGRFFCSWFCPFGSIHHFVGYIGRRKKPVAKQAALNQYRAAQAFKYYVLIFLLTAAAAGLIADLLKLTRTHPEIFGLLAAAILLIIAWLSVKHVISSNKTAALILFIILGFWILAGFFVPLKEPVAASLQTGLLDPIPLLYRSVNLVLIPIFDSDSLVLSAQPRYYELSLLTGTVFLAAVFLNLLIPRFYCRFICPLGALLGVLGRYSIWRIGKQTADCRNCGLCEANCEGACNPSGQIRTSECVLCLNCLHVCEDGLMGYRTMPSAAGEIAAPDISRRGFIISLISGLIFVPATHMGGRLASNWHISVLRPPGALPESNFLARCIKCGLCMRSCPTNVIQPAGVEGGFESLWTPVLNNRIGTSGCQIICIACGNVCPTGAIRPISLDEKLGRNEFAGVGPIRMGTAFIDRGRCLPWAMDRPCIVCQENCPLSPKAIYTREEFQTVRDGTFVVESSGRLDIELKGAGMKASKYATGDYYCIISTGTPEDRRLIVKNSKDSISISPDRPLNSMPAPGTEIEIQVRLQRPYVDPEVCTGCGICEHECPVRGKRAIRITPENESRNKKHSLIP